MQYTHDGIYTYVESRINTESRPVYCTGDYEPTPSEFPCVYIHETDHRPMRNAVQFNFEDEQRIESWEVQVFSNLTDGALEEAREIMADAEVAFRQLFFIETMCAERPNIDTSVKRIIATFTRVIGSGDQMPDFD